MPVIVDKSGRAVIPFLGRNYPLSRARLVHALPHAGGATLAVPVVLATPFGSWLGDPSGVVVGRQQVHVSRFMSAGRIAATRPW